MVPIDLSASDTPATAAAKFTHKPDAIILLFGSFEASFATQVRSMLGRALIPIALLTNAAVVDDGSSEGIAGLLGQVAQQVESTPILLGISRLDGSPESNHSEVMRLPAEWTDADKTRFLIAVELARSKTEGEKPVIGVLVGGNDDDKRMALRCARHGWPLVIMQGIGGIGDTLVAAGAPPAADGTKPTQPTDPELLEILESATIYSFQMTATTDEIKRAFVGPIQKPGDVLADAWSRFYVLDEAAKTKQALFRTTQLWILSLTVVVTVLAIVTQLSKKLLPDTPLRWIGGFPASRLQGTLHIVMVIVPIAISILVGFNARFREGNKWILLRAAAEAIKREIFRYRMRAGLYSEAQSRDVMPSTRLAANIKDITGNLVQSEVNRTSLPKALKSASAEGENEAQEMASLKFLNAEEYLRDRVDDQIGYFVARTEQLSRRLKTLQICILVAGGLGTFLAAIGGEIWVALTTAVATALTNKLEIEQVENSLVQYNMALTNLRNVESWWWALTPWEKTRQNNLNLLVDQTETTLEHETTGWVQQMQSTLDKLTEKESQGDQKGTGDTK